MLATTFLFSYTSKNKEVAIQTTKSFFNNLKNDNSDQMIALYPDFININSFYKSDSIIIKEVKSLDNNKYEVSLENYYTNGYGKKFNQNISLYLGKDINSKEIKYYIYDSKGIFGYEDNDEYKFAKKLSALTMEM